MTRAEVKEWLKSIKKNRLWLAGKLNVSVRTVNSWLYGERPIPGHTELLIQAFMRELPALPLVAPVRSISAPCTQEEKEAIQKAASVVHEGEEAFVLNASLTRARNVLSSHGKE